MTQSYRPHFGKSAAYDTWKGDLELTLAFFYLSTQRDCCLAVLASSVLVVELISRGEGSPSTFHNRLKLRWTMVDQRKSDPKSFPLLHACHPLALLAHFSNHRDMMVNSEKLLA